MSDTSRSSASPAKLLGYVTIAVGVAVLVGWFCKFPALTSVLPGFVTMKTNTALGFILAGVSLALLGRAPPSAAARWISQACAAAVALLGLLTLCQYLFGLNFGIDQLLIHEPAGAVGTLSPGRMAPASAFIFLVFGCALLVAGSRRGIATAQRLALVTGLLGLLPLLGYLYGATALIGVGQYTRMAVHTAVLFIVLSLGVLLLRPAEGVMRLVTGDTSGGWLLRRLAPYIVGIPLLLGWLRMQGERGGYFESALGTALMMLILMLLFFSIIWWTAHTLIEDETARKREEENLRRFATVVRDSNDAITIQDFAGNITAWNRGAELMYGYSEVEALYLNIGHLTPPDKVEEQRDFTRRLLAGEAITSFETQRVTKDGRVLDVWMTVTRLLDDTGKPNGIASTERDITARKREEKKLQESKNYLDNLIDYANAPIIVWDSHFHITRFNHAFEALTGRPASEVIGNTLEFLFPRVQIDSSMALIKKTTGGARWETVEISIIHLDGSVRTVLWNSATIFDADGTTPVATIAQGHDITQRKQAEDTLREAKEHLERKVFERTAELNTALTYNRSLLEASVDSLVTIGADGKITDVNQATEKMTGRTRQQLIGTDFSDYFTDPEQARAGYQRVFADGFIRDYDLQLRSKDGQLTPVQYNATVYHDDSGDIVGVFAAARDVTAIKRAETEMMALNRELMSRTTELEAVNHELEAFSYSVSHDLKAPLRSVDGFARFLEEDYGDRLDDEGRRLLTVIRDSARDMGQLVNDLLAFSRLSRTELAMTRLEMGTLVREVWTKLEAHRAERQVTLHVDTLPIAFGDVATVREVLVNLLANAIKFTRLRAQAIIEVTGHAEAGEVVYKVKDNGAGFDVAYADKLFGVFQRLHGSEEFEGTGIGLALVQRIVLRHGGRVWAEGTVNEGATFYFTLPQNTTKESRI